MEEEEKEKILKLKLKINKLQQQALKVAEEMSRIKSAGLDHTEKYKLLKEQYELLGSTIRLQEEKLSKVIEPPSMLTKQ